MALHELTTTLDEIQLLDEDNNPTGLIVSGDLRVLAEYDTELGSWTVLELVQETYTPPVKKLNAKTLKFEIIKEGFSGVSELNSKEHSCIFSAVEHVLSASDSYIDDLDLPYEDPNAEHRIWA